MRDDGVPFVFFFNFLVFRHLLQFEFLSLSLSLSLFLSAVGILRRAEQNRERKKRIDFFSFLLDEQHGHRAPRRHLLRHAPQEPLGDLPLAVPGDRDERRAQLGRPPRDGVADARGVRQKAHHLEGMLGVRGLEQRLEPARHEFRRGSRRCFLGGVVVLDRDGDAVGARRKYGMTASYDYHEMDLVPGAVDVVEDELDGALGVIGVVDGEEEDAWGGHGLPFLGVK